jgi:MoaA/NifB/PqqE/SkfB family radical SAM enzyme
VNTLVPIFPDPAASVLAVHTIHALPVLVIFPHNQCNCRCVMCDIWRIRQAQQLSPADVEPHLSGFRKLGVSWVVLSGGEPQLNEKWSYLANLLRSAGCRVTLLTAGLLLEAQATLVVDSVDDVIVSLDGPAAIHNSIRRVPDAFERLADGVRTLHRLKPHMPVRARCTVQKGNYASLRATVRSAKELGLTSVSFLAADLTSTAFNRPEGWSPDRANRVALSNKDVETLQAEVDHLIDEHRTDLQSGFVVESAQKLGRIVDHFRAHLGQTQDVAPRCNAPWVSAVIEASGDVRPCFFHPVLGNIHRHALRDIVNSPEALRFRSNLDVASNEICKRCVCSLYVPGLHEPAQQ